MSTERTSRLLNSAFASWITSSLFDPLRCAVVAFSTHDENYKHSTVTFEDDLQSILHLSWAEARLHRFEVHVYRSIECLLFLVTITHSILRDSYPCVLQKLIFQGREAVSSTSLLPERWWLNTTWHWFGIQASQRHSPNGGGVSKLLQWGAVV